MAICEDFAYIANRLREIEQQKRGGPDVPNPAPADAAASSQAASEDFDEWFSNLIWSTCC